MQSYRNTPLLKFALIADALASGATGLLMTAGAGLLTSLLALPEPLLLYAGLFLLPYAALVAWAGLRQETPRQAVIWIAAVNIVWSVGSFALIASDVVSPSLLGHLFVVAQATVVGIFAILQIVGLRRTGHSLMA